MDKRRGGVFLIIFGVVAAIAVGVLVFSVTRQAAAQKVETTNVVVALQDVPERTVLTPALVGLRQTLPESLPPGALTSVEQVNGRMTTTKLLAGEPVLTGRLADTSGKAGVAYTLEPGNVLMTLPASDIVGTGAVKPGDHVDLLVTVMPNDKQDDRSESDANVTPTPVPAGAEATQDLANSLPATTQVTMQDLVVVGVGQFAVAPAGQDAAKQTPAGSLLTFAVSHGDALVLKSMKDEERVKIEIVLRAAGDDQTAKTNPIQLETILEKYGFGSTQSSR